VSSGGPPLQLANLHNTFETVAQLAGAEVARGEWLDAFLLLAGLNQIAEDYLQRDLAQSRKIVTRLGRRSAALAGAAGGLSRVALGLRSFGVGQRRTVAWQARVEATVDAVADRVAAVPGHRDGDELRQGCTALLRGARGLPRGLREQVVRVPACFRGTDQEPADCVALAERFAERWSDRGRPITVIGIRTCGSYLAPLVGAALRSMGFSEVISLTCRPDRPLGARSAGLIRRGLRSSGLVLVVDYPPVSGQTYRKVVRQLAGLGVPDAAVVLLIALCGEGSQVPDGLGEFQTVVLPWADWSFHRRLRPDAVRDSLARLLIGRRVEITRPDGTRAWVLVGAVDGIHSLPLAPVSDLKGGSWTRRHCRARYGIRVTDRDSGRSSDAEVYVKGVGVGYIGAHSLALSSRLGEFLPPVYGIDGGFLFRGWLPDAPVPAPDPTHEVQLAHRVAAYVAARRDRFRLDFDPTVRLGEQKPAWHSAADWLKLSFGFGPTRLLARPALHVLSRRLLRPSSPTVVDGSMAVTRWHGQGDQAVKVDYDERGMEIFSCNSVFDVAFAAADHELQAGGRGSFGGAARQRYQELTGETIDDVRWLIHKTVYLRSYLLKLSWAWVVSPLTEEGRREMAGELDAVRRALSRVHQDYMAAAYFADVVPPETGPICAIDIDGVLETGRLDYPTITPAGALALRALARHGRRAVLVTGRSLSELRERCAAYRLVGGVAEYGASAYDHRSGRETLLFSESAGRQLAGLRDWLRSQPVYVDSVYEHVVRAYTVQGLGERRPLDDEMVRRVLDHAGGPVTVVAGLGQVDFVPAGVDKASGLRGLLGQIGAGDRLEMAIGDTEADLPMLRLAERAYAPANASAELRRSGIRTMSRPAQAGLAQAVAELIGHRPGSCADCRPLPLPPEGRMLVGVLGAADRTSTGRLLRALNLNRHAATRP
jgi:hydroxymethylpyrimidine pyrophosphatase-like HAD family hydrolase